MQTGFHKPVRFAMTLVIDVSYFAAGYLKSYGKLSAKFSYKYSSVLVCLIDQYIF